MISNRLKEALYMRDPHPRAPSTLEEAYAQNEARKKMTVACEICGKAPPNDDVSLVRLNRQGVKGRWTCLGDAPVFGEWGRRNGIKVDPDNDHPLTDEQIDDCVSEYKAERTR